MNYKIIAAVFSMLAVVEMGLVLHEQGLKQAAQAQAQVFYEEYKAYREYASTLTEKAAGLDECLKYSDAQHYCAVEYDENGEVVDVTLNKYQEGKL